MVLRSDEDNKEWVGNLWNVEYKELSVKNCDDNGLSYLGMHTKKNQQDNIIINMYGYINEILKEYQEVSPIHEYVVPAESNLFDHDEKTEKIKDSSFFHRTVAKLLYLSK